MITLKIVLILYFLWITVVFVYQFSEPLRDALGFLPVYLCGLLPAWRMFGPRPVDEDYRISYRVREAGGAFSDWKPIPPARKGWAAGSLFFHPQAHEIKAMRDICFEVHGDGVVDSMYYQILLHWVLGEVRRREPAGNQVQFQVYLKKQAILNLQFQSYVHGLF